VIEGMQERTIDDREEPRTTEEEKEGGTWSHDVQSHGRPGILEIPQGQKIFQSWDGTTSQRKPNRWRGYDGIMEITGRLSIKR